MDSIIDSIFNGVSCGGSVYSKKNDYEAYVKDDVLHLNLDFAGRDKKDFNVFVEDGVLNINVSEKEKINEDIDWIIKNTRRACSYTYTPNFDIDSEKITASYENGVLKIKAPKAVGAKQKKIKVE